MDNRTTETSERTYIYSGRVGQGMVEQGKAVYGRTGVRSGVGWGGGRGRGRVKWCGAGWVGSGLG